MGWLNLAGAMLVSGGADGKISIGFRNVYTKKEGSTKFLYASSNYAVVVVNFGDGVGVSFQFN